MPLASGSSPSTVSSNIEELSHSARKRPHDQIVAIALNTARKTREGGGRVRLHTGAIHAPVAGRTDHLPMHVPHKSYVLPADIVSGMGEGNTMAGFKIAQALPRSMFQIHNRTRGVPYGQSDLPYGAPSPEHSRGGRSDHTGSTTGAVPIVAAGGEHVYGPDECAMCAPDGNPDTGHKILDEFVKQYRAELVKKLGGLPGPKKD